VSKGSKELLEIVQQLFPNQRVELEYNIASQGGLFLDIYLPRLKIAFEYDGPQHFTYSKHFHGNREAFFKARHRDAEKNELCEQRGITLIRVAYNESMTKEDIMNKLEGALNG
jgi:very-short-patch-repair endonuclease